MNEPINPYQPSGEATDRAYSNQKMPLRFILAAIMGMFGMAALMMGVIAVIVSYQLVFVDNDTTHWGEMLAACLLYSAIGIYSLLSAVRIGRGEYRKGAVAGIFSLALTVVLFTVAGM